MSAQSDIFKVITQNVGNLLNAIFVVGKPVVNEPDAKMPELSAGDLTSYFDQTPQGNMVLHTTLAILQILGLIVVEDNGSVRACSRYGHFAIGSLSRFFLAGLPVGHNLSITEVQRPYLVALTSALEEVRRITPALDHQPIHARTIVNVLIKGRQIRNWQERDVYLCMLHPEWNEYHLIGLSDKGDIGKTTEKLVEEAMKRQLGLTKDRYRIELAFAPPARKLEPEISKTSGALTEYTYRLVAVSSMNVDINQQIQTLMAESKKSVLQMDKVRRFRWFTLEEIKAAQGRNGEIIMTSTRDLLTDDVDLRLVKPITHKARDISRNVSVWNVFSNQFTVRQIAWIGGPFIILLVVALLLALLSRASPQDSALAQASNLATIVQTILAFVGLILAYRSHRLNQSR